jgi:hypothetical protein
MTPSHRVRAFTGIVLLAATACVAAPPTQHAPAPNGQLDSAAVVSASMNAFLSYYQRQLYPDTVPDDWKSYKVIRYTRGDGWVEVVLGPANPHLIGGGARFRVYWGLVADLKELFP